MNNETLGQKNIKDLILKKIQAGEISMKSKYYFTLKVSVLVFVVLVTILTSALLISYTFFSLEMGGHMALLDFGGRGLYNFFLVFPWLLLLVNVLLLLFLDFLLKRFRFGYRSPIIYLFLGTLGAITVLGYLINFTSLHGDLLKRAEEKNLPIAGGFYDHIRVSDYQKGFFRGTIVSIDGNTFVMEHPPFDKYNPKGHTKVIAPINAKIPELYVAGDEVFVAGDLVNGDVHAYGLRKLQPNE